MPIYEVSFPVTAKVCVKAESVADAEKIAYNLDGHHWNMEPDGAEPRYDVQDVSEWCDDDDAVNV